MKASHRREVFVARLVFAIICLVIIGGIVALIVQGVQKKAAIAATQTAAESESDTQILIMDLGDRETEIATEPVETEPVVVHLKTTRRVNLRPQPSTDGTPITTLEAGTVVVLLSEEGEWAHVQYGDQTGYIKTEYAAEVEVE